MKESIYSTAKYITLLTAIGQLAISQVHIKIITKVFAPHVGFFLFLFIIFGVVTGFNALSSLSGKKVLLFIGGAIIACVNGGIYLGILLKDIAEGSYLTIDEARVSIIFMFISLAIYFLGGIVMIITREKHEH